MAVILIERRIQLMCRRIAQMMLGPIVDGVVTQTLMMDGPGLNSMMLHTAKVLGTTHVLGAAIMLHPAHVLGAAEVLGTPAEAAHVGTANMSPAEAAHMAATAHVAAATHVSASAVPATSTMSAASVRVNPRCGCENYGQANNNSNAG